MAVAGDARLHRRRLPLPSARLHATPESPPLPQVLRGEHQKRDGATAATRGRNEPSARERDLQQHSDDDKRGPDPEREPHEKEEEKEGGEGEEATSQTRRDPPHDCARRLHPLLLSGVPHGLPRKRPAGAAPGGAHAGAALRVRHLRRGSQEEGPPDAPQTVAQPGAAVRVHGVPEGVQEEGAAHAALRHTLGGEAAHLHRVRQGLLQEGPPEEAHQVAHRAQGEGGAVAAGGRGDAHSAGAGGGAHGQRRHPDLKLSFVSLRHCFGTVFFCLFCLS